MAGDVMVSPTQMDKIIMVGIGLLLGLVLGGVALVTVKFLMLAVAE